MSNFYLRNRHLFEEASEIPYAYQAERLYQLLPKLKYDQKLPRDIFREKESDDHPPRNIFAQNARTLLGNNYDAPPSYPQQQPHQDRYSYPAQRDSFPQRKDVSPPRDPFKRDVQPPQRDPQPFLQHNYPAPRESHHRKNDSSLAYDPFKKGDPYSNKPETNKNDQRGAAAGLSKPKYEDQTNTRRRYPQQHSPSPSPFAIYDPNDNQSDPRRNQVPRNRIPTDISPSKDIPAAGAGRRAYNRVSSAIGEGSSFLEHPASFLDAGRNRGRKEPSPPMQQAYEPYSNPQPVQQRQQPFYYDEISNSFPPLRQKDPEPVLSRRGGREKSERRSESPKYYTMGPRGSPKKITQAISESIKQNIFPNHAYINVKKRVLNVRGDLSRLDEAPFPQDKTVLTATLQNRAEQLGSLGNNKSMQEALEYRILATVPGDRKERLKKLLQKEGSIQEGI